MSRSDAGSSGSVSAAVGAPSEDRIWSLMTLVKDDEGHVVQKNYRKVREKDIQSVKCNRCAWVQGA